MTDLDFILAPVRLFGKDRILSGSVPEALPPGCELIGDLDRAMVLENSQDLSPGYSIWADKIARAQSLYNCEPAAAEGRKLIDAEANLQWQARGPFELELNRKRLRRIITPYEELWLTTAYDLLELLKSIALGRHVLGEANAPVLEQAQTVIACGFYPCGWQASGHICAFDPRVLKGFSDPTP